MYRGPESMELNSINLAQVRDFRRISCLNYNITEQYSEHLCVQIIPFDNPA